MQQKLLWIPKRPDNITTGQLVVDYPFPTRPKRLWSLYYQENESSVPDLPISPIHNQNSFLEDWGHDYHIKNGKLYYCSRVTNGGIWILLEFEDK